MLNKYLNVEITAVYLIARLDRFLVLITALDLPEFDDGKGLAIVDLLRRLHDDAALALEVEEVALAQLRSLNSHAPQRGRHGDSDLPMEDCALTPKEPCRPNCPCGDASPCELDDAIILASDTAGNGDGGIAATGTATN